MTGFVVASGPLPPPVEAASATATAAETTQPQAAGKQQRRQRAGRPPLLVAWVSVAFSLVAQHFLTSTATLGSTLAHAALAVPRLLAPVLRPAGRQVCLRSVPAMLQCFADAAAADPFPASQPPAAPSGGRPTQPRAGHSSGGGGGGGGCGYLEGIAGDPLLPLRVPGRHPLAMHRMISYRARLMDLFMHHWQLQLQA